MKLKRFYTLVLFSGALFYSTLLAEEISVQELYSNAMKAFQNNQWSELVSQCRKVTKNYSDTSFASDALYYMSVGYFRMEDYEMANQKFSEYLKLPGTPKYFEEAIHYKFSIAENFRLGAKKHIFQWSKMPKWLPAKEDALKLYDEVLTTFPYHNLAAKSLYGKGIILKDFDEFRESIEAFQILIRRFPKHELAIESFLEIGKVYLNQCKYEHLNPDLLDSAVLNLRKFELAFPSEIRLEEAREVLNDMREAFAISLFETGDFFERTKKKGAAIIYYSKVVSKFPHSNVAKRAQGRLEILQK